MAFEKDPNELGAIWLKTWPDGGVSFSGKAFNIPDGLYQLAHFSFVSKKDGSTVRGIRVVKATDQSQSDEAGEFHEEFVPAFAEVAGEKAPF